jgi:hypothetical protein
VACFCSALELGFPAPRATWLTRDSGRGGSKITEIRRLSGSRISIAKVPHDETGERMFTIVGTAESTERALMLLYSQVSVDTRLFVGMSFN